MAPILLTPTQPANKEVRDRSLKIAGEVIKSQLPSTPQELMIDLVSMSKGMLPVDVGKAIKVLSKSFKGPGGPKWSGLVPVPVGGPSLKVPTSTPINPAAPLAISKQAAKTAKPLTPAQQGRRKNTKNRRRRQQPPLASLRQLSRDMMLPDEVLVAVSYTHLRAHETLR